MRRYARHATEPSVSTEHLDPDELNAFAEGRLPAATRSLYVSHLADCGDCRQLASQLAIASGAATHAHVPASAPVEQKSWWQKFGFILAPQALKYGAFAAVLLAVVGVALVVWRQPKPRNADLIARHEPSSNQVGATNPAEPAAPLADRSTETSSAAQPRISSVPTPSSNVAKGGADASPSTLSPPPPPKAETEAGEVMAKAGAGAGVVRPQEQARAESSPSYAPAPVSEYRVESKSREQQQNIGNVSQGGPRRNESYEKYKNMDRYGDVAKARDDDRSRATTDQAKISENKQEESAIRGRRESQAPAASIRAADDKRTVARKADAPESPKDEADSQTRSAGGRKFRRQGNAWVDAKFKSSMAVRNVARGSDEFGELDSGLRSIAQQISGELVVVWKGKAYRFR